MSRDFLPLERVLKILNILPHLDRIAFRHEGSEHGFKISTPPCQYSFISRDFLPYKKVFKILEHLPYLDRIAFWHEGSEHGFKISTSRCQDSFMSRN